MKAFWIQDDELGLRPVAWPPRSCCLRQIQKANLLSLSLSLSETAKRQYCIHWNLHFAHHGCSCTWIKRFARSLNGQLKKNLSDLDPTVCTKSRNICISVLRQPCLPATAEWPKSTTLLPFLCCRDGEDGQDREPWRDRFEGGGGRPTTVCK